MVCQLSTIINGVVIIEASAGTLSFSPASRSCLIRSWSHSSYEGGLVVIRIFPRSFPAIVNATLEAHQPSSVHVYHLITPPPTDLPTLLPHFLAPLLFCYKALDYYNLSLYYSNSLHVYIGRSQCCLHE